MKTLLAFFAAAGLAGAAFAAEKWTKSQQEVADVFKAWSESELTADIEREMSLLAPGFTAWDYSQPAPMDRAAYRQMAVDLFKQARLPFVSWNRRPSELTGTRPLSKAGIMRW